MGVFSMKWFKHLSTARNDERIARLEDKCGLEGYGFYFKMLELVAEAIDQSDKCVVTYSMSRWGRQTNITTKKWLFLASCCADVDLMIVQRCNDDITVNIPNLLKYRDNHTKNLQVTSQQDIDKYKEDKDKERDIKTTCAEPIGSPLPQPDRISKKIEGIDGKATAKKEKIVLPMVIELPLCASGTYFPVTQKDIDEWSGLYPAVDVLQDLRSMIGWLNANPSRRKTKTGIRSFINSWLAKTQNSGQQKSLNSVTNRNSGLRQPAECPTYVYQGNQGAIDSTATEILHDSARL